MKNPYADGVLTLPEIGKYDEQMQMTCIKATYEDNGDGTFRAEFHGKRDGFDGKFVVKYHHLYYFIDKVYAASNSENDEEVGTVVFIPNEG